MSGPRRRGPPGASPRKTYPSWNRRADVPERWTVWPAFLGVDPDAIDVVTVDVYPPLVLPSQGENAEDAAITAVEHHPGWSIPPAPGADMAVMTRNPSGYLQVVEHHTLKGGSVVWIARFTCQGCGCTTSRLCMSPNGRGNCSACLVVL